MQSFQRIQKPQNNFPSHVQKQSFWKSLQWVHILIYTLLLLLYVLFSIGDEIHMSAFPFVLSTLLSEALIYFLAFYIDYSEPYRRENMILETQRQNRKQKQRAKRWPQCQVSHICSVSQQGGGAGKACSCSPKWNRQGFIAKTMVN